MKLTGNIGETIFISSSLVVNRVVIDPLTMTWTIIPATPIKPPPTEDEKKVHRAINVGNGDPKRFGHGHFIGDDE